MRCCSTHSTVLLLIYTCCHLDLTWSFVLSTASALGGATRGIRLWSEIRVREWSKNDVDKIQDLLQQASMKNEFDPEGPLKVDCGSVSAIGESYDEGGCFLVATDTGTDKIVGTCALITGSQVTYYQSGSSMSTPTVKGAVRRTCCSVDCGPSRELVILKSLLTAIEVKAKEFGATELIALNYKDKHRLHSDLLQEVGFRKLPEQIPGVDSQQYRKELAASSDKSKDETDAMGNPFEGIIGVSLIAILLVSIVSVGNLMGLEVFPSEDNRGIGAPLSREELQLLQQDERLQRTDLDGGSGNNGIRQWNELTDEERREEAALMKIIGGKEIRLQ